MRQRTSGPLLALAVLVIAILGACGGDSDTAGAAGATDGAAKACAAGEGTTHTVDIGAFLFEPTPLAVERCDSVVWMNAHDQSHTSTGDGEQKWSTGNIAPGSTSAEPVRFETAGSFAYICALHPFMKGAVTVAG